MKNLLGGIKSMRKGETDYRVKEENWLIKIWIFLCVLDNGGVDGVASAFKLNTR